MFTKPTVEEFKVCHARDFPFGDDPEQHVLDSDITKAMVLANSKMNDCLFCDQEEYALAYCLLTAHYIVSNLQNSSQGLCGGYDFLTSSKSVGSVSISSAIPQKFLDNPTYGFLAKTGYGAQFLELILPRLVGAVFVVGGKTHA